MKKEDIDIMNVAKLANNELFLFGAINSSMLGGFTMFVSYLCGVCIGALFIELAYLMHL